MVDALLFAVAAVACDALTAVICVSAALVPHRCACVAVLVGAHIRRFVVVVAARVVPAPNDGPAPRKTLDGSTLRYAAPNPQALGPDNLGVVSSGRRKATRVGVLAHL